MEAFDLVISSAKAYWELIESNWEMATGFFGVLALFLTFWWSYLPAIRLVWRCLAHEQRFPFWSTLNACLVCAYPLTPGMFRKQMRLWLELRLLRPKPARNLKWVHHKSKKRFVLDRNEAEYRRELEEWKGDIRGKFAAIKLEQKEPVIQVDNVFKLNSDVTRNGIKQYLLSVSELNLCLDEEASFLCKIRISEGFLLPLNLLAGLMSEFDEDWDPIISSYPALAKGGFSALQMAIFDLWLLWGPSVPICKCDQWSGPIALQYGFGDENNSIRVFVRDEAKTKLLEDLCTAVATRSSKAYAAMHASITGELWPPSSFREEQFCAAQKQHIDPNQEAFILKYHSHSLNGDAAGGHLMYTAYVWALFVIGRDEKPSLEKVKAEPWLHVIPFFEHGNIVNEATYEAAKLLLAHKVLSFIKNWQRFESSPGQAPLRLWYVCALDDSGCGHSLEVVPKSATILSVIESLLGENQYASLRQQLITDDRSYAEILSGCHLPDMVSDFFGAIGGEPADAIHDSITIPSAVRHEVPGKRAQRQRAKQAVYEN